MAVIQYKVRDRVAEILVNNPPVNALTHEVMDALLAALARARDDSDAHAVVIGSAIAKRFCAGLDLAVVRKSSASQVQGLLDKLYAQLYGAQIALGKPTVAAISGATRGGGMTVAISCDLIVAAQTTTFGYPELDVGLLPAIHYTHLPRIIGRYRAFDLLFTGRIFDAQEALSLGLVSRLAPEGDVLAEAHTLARTLAAKSPQLVALGKDAFYRAQDCDYRAGVASAVHLATVASTLEDSQEGMCAFVEKRKPVWKSPTH